MKGMASLGKSKKQGSGTLDANGEPLGSPHTVPSPKAPKAPKAPKEEGSGKQGLLAKISRRTSLKSKKTKSGTIENGVDVPPALRISKSQQELKSAFKVFDADNDGRISTAELSSVLTSLGGAISEQEVLQLMKEVDTDNDGFISLEEFIEFHHPNTPASAVGEISPVHDPVRDAFRTFDKDGDSRISASELQSVFVSLGDKGHSLEECRQMISSVDKDGDGYVDFVEFQVLMGGQDQE